MDGHDYGMEGDFIDCNVKVELRSDESQQAFLKRFHKEVRKSKILERKQRKSYYTKDSKKKRIARRKKERKLKDE